MSIARTAWPTGAGQEPIGPPMSGFHWALFQESALTVEVAALSVPAKEGEDKNHVAVQAGI